MKKLIVLCMLVGVPAFASPAKDLKLVGFSEMNWMFWKLYDIRLFSSNGQYHEDQYPLALAIEYARDIESAMLVKSTLKEWKRLSVNWKPSWQQQLQEIWPSVSAGDELLLLVERDGVSRFFYNKKFVGEIEDAEFAQAFLSIWLSANTREPELRRQLLGANDA